MDRTAWADPLVDDVAMYLKLEQDDIVNAVEHFDRMRERYSPPRVRTLPGPRYEFRRPGERQGILIDPIALDRVAEERNTYEEGSEAWETLTDYMAEVYHVGGTLERDVYADGEAVWVDDGEAMERVDSVGEAMPLDELVGAYEMAREMGASEDARGVFQQISSVYRIGYVDPDQDLLLYYDADGQTVYVFDTFEIDLRQIEGSIPEVLDELGSIHDDAGEAVRGMLEDR